MGALRPGQHGWSHSTPFHRGHQVAEGGGGQV